MAGEDPAAPRVAGAELTQQEILMEEVKALTRTPTVSIPWGGRATPLA